MMKSYRVGSKKGFIDRDFYLGVEEIYKINSKMKSYLSMKIHPSSHLFSIMGFQKISSFKKKKREKDKKLNNRESLSASEFSAVFAK